ncbi:MULTISPECIES: HesB/IscA family protein [Microbacterium]|uniref:Fe-S cluster assembly protein HesB n=1 Tax=Microbacterium marmarense TaxID=3122051 RepID=A0ABU8LSA3_9MICO
MLTLTENATTAVKNLLAQIPVDTAGLRISEATTPDEGFALNLADAPEAGDTVVEDSGARVFVDTVANVQLDDRVLDARVDENGGVGFALAQQR